jgi:amidase
MTSEPAKWQLIAWQKKDEQHSRIPSEWLLKTLPPSTVTSYMDVPRKCGILNAEELKITEDYDAIALAEAIRNRKLTSVDVVRAFCKVRSSFTFP